MKNMNWIGWVAIVLVVAAVITGFVVVGSPSKQRDMKFDQQRVNDLSNIQYEIRNYWNTTSRLPASLDDLTSDISGFKAAMDPETNQPYGYRIKDGLNFELCATFNLESTQEDFSRPYAPMYMHISDNWQHGAGPVCFDRTINPELDRTTVPPIK